MGFLPDYLRKRYRRGNIAAMFVVAILIVLLALAFHAALANAESLPPSSHARPNVYITLDITRTDVIGSIALLPNGDDCDSCGEIAKVHHRGKVYYELRWTATQRLVHGSYTYQQVDRHGRFNWSGKGIITNDWRGGRRKRTMNMTFGKRSYKMRLVSASAQIYDTAMPPAPPPPVESGLCGPSVSCK